MNNKTTKVCPQCSEEILSTAKKCPKCQSDIRPWHERHPGIVAFIVLTIIILFNIGLNSDKSSNTTDNSSSDTNNSWLMSGSEGILKSYKKTADQECDAGTTIFAAENIDDYKSFDRSLNIRDTEDTVELMGSEKVFRVPECTGVRVLETKAFSGYSQVRILDGKYTNTTAWVKIDEVFSK